MAAVREAQALLKEAMTRLRIGEGETASGRSLLAMLPAVSPVADQDQTDASSIFNMPPRAHPHDEYFAV